MYGFKKVFNSISINHLSFLVWYLGPSTIGLSFRSFDYKKLNKFTVWSVYNRLCNHRLMEFR